MKVLIKIGGTLLESDASRHEIARQLAEIAREHALVAVHGGGKQLTRFLEERGVQSRFVNGLRVSDEFVIDAVTKVVAGSVNKQFVAALIQAGLPAVGLSGADGPLTVARQLDPALGWVGKPVSTDGRLLDALLESGYTPAVACIAGDGDGHIYNVNADQMAASCATGWRADRLIFLTDVEGVKDAEGRLFRELTSREIADLVASGVAHGGMQAKLEASLSALQSGVPELTIAGGHTPGVCIRLLHGETLGTRVMTPLSSTPASDRGAAARESVPQ
jgi:acetylglutamate kinase